MTFSAQLTLPPKLLYNYITTEEYPMKLTRKLTYKLTTLLITFALILGTVTLPASAAGMPFTDVKYGDWYYYNVQYCYENGIMSGVSAKEFAPQSAITRGMLVTMLYRLAGKPAVAVTSGFPDVTGDWYFAPVYWAKENSVVSGYPDGTFRPNAPITRAELVVVLYGYAKNIEGKDVSNSTALSFNDTADIGNWAKPAVAWAVAHKIVAGKPGNVFDPQGGATRAEGAAILHRYIDPTFTPPDLSAYKFPYDTEKIIADAKAYGASIGMTWSDELTIDNASWEAPGMTSAATVPDWGLKNAIEGRIDRIKWINLDNGFGDDPTWYFRIIFMPQTEYYATYFPSFIGNAVEGEYKIFFLF
jgi:hypothetical protein